MIFKIFNSFASNKFKTLKTTYNIEAILKWGDVTWEARTNTLNYLLYWIYSCLLVILPLQLAVPLNMIISGPQSFWSEHILRLIVEKVKLLFYAVRDQCRFIYKWWWEGQHLLWCWRMILEYWEQLLCSTLARQNIWLSYNLSLKHYYRRINKLAFEIPIWSGASFK